MKFIHISDLHLGKRLNEYSFIEDQEFILNKILGITDEIKPDGVIIAGDIYDKTSPSAEAYTVFDNFLTALAQKDTEVFIISGNHDSPEKLSFASRLIDAAGIHISPVYDGEIKPFEMYDSFGKVNIYMLPFIKPVHVRKYADREITSYNEAVKFAVSSMNINKEERNILITHQFVTGSKRSDSEDVSVGGTDNVDASVFEDFDYTALGHIHSPQSCTEKIRYCGTPLKYSFSEANDKKSVTVFEIREKGDLEISTLPLVPLRDLCSVKGFYSDIMQKSFYENTCYKDAYMRIILTDEEQIPDVHAKLKTVYRNLAEVSYENKRTAVKNKITAADTKEKRSPFEYFAEFYALQNNSPMNEQQAAYIKELTEEIWEGEQ